MTKIATTLINNIKDYIDENPDMVKNVLGAGAIGAGAGGLLFGGGSPYETTGQKVKRRLKNALIGGALASGAAAMLTNGTKQLANAMPADKETPYEVVSKVPSSGAARALYAALGGSVGGAVSKTIKKDGINILRNKLTKHDNIGIVGKLLKSMPEATLSNGVVAGNAAQDVANVLSGTPDLLHKVLGNGMGPKNFESVKEVRKILHRAGVNTSKMTKALPGYIPFTHKALADINMDNKLGKWLLGKKPVEKLIRKMTSNPTGPMLAPSAYNMDNSVVRSILHPGVGKGLVTGLATAGAFAPEIISAVNKVRSAL